MPPRRPPARARWTAFDAAARPFTVHNPHSLPAAAPSPTLTPGGKARWVQVAAIDPAIANCAIRVERRTYPDPADADHFTSETILFVKLNFAAPPGVEATATAMQAAASRDAFANAAEWVAHYADYFSACQFILVEEQVRFRWEMMRMVQALITTLSIVTRDRGVRPLIVEIAARVKTAVFGAPPMDKSDRKDWAVRKAIEVFRANGEPAHADYIASLTKADDLADTVCYTTAWFRMLQSGAATPSLETLLIS